MGKKKKRGRKKGGGGGKIKRQLYIIIFKVPSGGESQVQQVF